ncbi:MAG: DNA translocase FtsK [Anaerolineales bacterium]|nr:DNA translocase FtsK [Anaerolineales bacterium]
MDVETNTGPNGNDKLQQIIASLSTGAKHRLQEMAALLFSGASLITALGLVNATSGLVIDNWVWFLRKWLGWGRYGVPVLFILLAVWSYRFRLNRETSIHWIQVIVVEVFSVCLLGLMASLTGVNLLVAEAGSGGGLIGWGIAVVLEQLIGSVPGGVVLAVLTLVSGFYLFMSFLAPVVERNHELFEEITTLPEVEQNLEAPVDRPSLFQPRRRNIPAQFRKNFSVPEFQDEKPASVKRRDELLPPLTILEDARLSRVTDQEINRAAAVIEKTLADFGIPASVVDFRTGPAITQFALEPGYIEQKTPDGIRKHKVRVSQISSLANDLALALSTPRLRIEAPVPGKAFIGVEVPNRSPAVVRLRGIIETQTFQEFESPLTVALGRDVSGNPVVADLASMPHLLIAGTTGSGKSVSIAALTLCLAMNNTPSELRLVMIDPKLVELVRFNGLPHIIGKVETDLERIIGVLRWLTTEMDRRYLLLERAKARDLATYNRRKRRGKEDEILPRIVVFIDELADLMMMAPDQTEHTLVRIAQMARAVGIHLVVATQRPSTDIVTGLIKANFPARMSFAVASGIDSRVILDTFGAETLLGKGDMLYLSAEASAPVRVQGVYVSDKEVASLVSYWQQSDGAVQDYEEDEEAPWEELLKKQIMIDETDEILDQAIKLVQREGTASASMLQRRLRIGYPRAARLIDELEEMGIIGRAQSGGKTREVLIEDSDFLEDAPDE